MHRRLTQQEYRHPRQQRWVSRYQAAKANRHHHDVDVLADIRVIYGRETVELFARVEYSRNRQSEAECHPVTRN